MMSRTTAARRKAQSIFRQFGAETIPVDVSEIAQKLKISIFFEPLEESVSGMLVIRQDRAAIGVNENHHPHRQRFTIAHELGHFLLHQEAAKVFVDSTLTFYRDERSSEGIYQQEIEANTFAAELLLPEQAIRTAFSQSDIDIFDDVAIARLAARFDVSACALMIRLVRLNLISG
jgi:Zn-dependent peptidase ImmA (M78 family)